MLNRDGGGLLDFEVSAREALLFVVGITLFRAAEWGHGMAQFPDVNTVPIAIAVGGITGTLTFGLAVTLDRVWIPLVVGVVAEFAILYALGVLRDPVQELASLAFIWVAAGIPLLFAVGYEWWTADA